LKNYRSKKKIPILTKPEEINKNKIFDSLQISLTPNVTPTDSLNEGILELEIIPPKKASPITREAVLSQILVRAKKARSAKFAQEILQSSLPNESELLPGKWPKEKAKFPRRMRGEVGHDDFSEILPTKKTNSNIFTDKPCIFLIINWRRYSY